MWIHLVGVRLLAETLLYKIKAAVHSGAAAFLFFCAVQIDRSEKDVAPGTRPFYLGMRSAECGMNIYLALHIDH